jgi:integrase
MAKQAKHKGTSEVVKLTKPVCDRATHAIVDGEPRQKLYMDAKTAGFGLCVGTQSKTFFAQGKVNGRSVRVTIGRYGVFTVDQAREDAEDRLREMRRGTDPNRAKRALQAGSITFADARDMFLDTCRRDGRSAETLKGYERAATYLKSWDALPLAEITRQMVKEKHERIAANVVANAAKAAREKAAKTAKENATKENAAIENVEGRGHYMANGVMRLFRAVYNSALRQHEDLPTNPTINVRWFKEFRRTDSAIPATGLADWYKGIMQIGNPIRRDYLRLVLYTGLRRTNAAEMRWEHVDLDAGIVLIPKPKSGRPFALPLSGYLLDLLRARKAENELLYPSRPWVFPSASSKSGHISEPKLKGMTFMIHGLRATFMTVAESIEIAPYAIKLLVNHAMPRGDVTGGYIQADAERLREPMERITARLRMLCEPPAKGERVVSIVAKG